MRKTNTLLAQSRELTRLAGIINSSRDAIYSIDLSAKVTTWNKGAEILFGYAKKDVLGKNLTALTVPDDRKKEIRKVLDLLQKKKDIPAFETIRKRKNGTLIHVLFSISYITDTKGNVTGASVIARDVTEQRKTILELAQANSILYNIIQNTPDAIFVKDLEGRYLLLNNATSSYFGLSTISMLGKKDDEIIHASTAAQIKKHDALVFKTQKPHQFEEELVVDGKTHTFLATKVPYFDHKKQLIGLIGISKDISDLKERQQVQEDMLAIVSHELKNPLTSISLYSQELQKVTEPTKTNTYAKKILGQTKKLNGFIHELLDLARIESKTLDLNYEEFALHEVIDELTESIHNEYPTHRIEVHGEYHFKIRADKLRFSQIVTNLLTNSIKYSPNANSVVVTINKDTDNLLIQIRDFGIGIPKKYQLHIFDKYFRVKNKNTPGTGLGLHIVAQVVQLHGGKIWVESKKNSGSTFFVSIPQVQKQK